MGLYDNDGNIKVTVAPAGYTGLYAPDGSFYVNVNPTDKGIYGPNGALNVRTDIPSSLIVYNPDGGLYAIMNGSTGILLLGKSLNSGVVPVLYPQTAAILGAGGLDYAFFNYMEKQFQDADGTIPATNGTSVALWNVRDKAPHFASQSVGGQRSVLQSDGLKFDGSDDNLLTDWFAQAGANCIMAQVFVPAAVGAYQVIAGSTASGADRFFLGVETSGRIACGVGNNSIGVIQGTTDIRGTSATVALVCDGANVRILVNIAQEYSATQSGSPTLVSAFRIGSNNAVNTPTQFFGGSIKRIAFGKTALTLEQFQTIRAEWLAAA